jgi:Na+:H+ antiporter, NhaA family
MSQAREQPPLHELERMLHPWVVFAIVPLFALANAGVSLGGDLASALTSPVVVGIVAGLVVGKQLGVTLFTWLAVKSGVSELPAGTSWRHVYGGGWLAGIGFTMSLFICVQVAEQHWRDFPYSGGELVADHPLRQEPSG